MFRRNQQNDPEDDVFIEYVELHERVWGNDTYSGRPRLRDILKAPVVAFWQSNKPSEGRQMITLHNDLEDVNTYISAMFLHSHTQRFNRRLARLYVDQKAVVVSGVRLVFRNSD